MFLQPHLAQQVQLQSSQSTCCRCSAAVGVAVGVAASPGTASAAAIYPKHCCGCSAAAVLLQPHLALAPPPAGQPGPHRSGSSCASAGRTRRLQQQKQHSTPSGHVMLAATLAAAQEPVL
jgi:hypothetical protein